MKYLGIPLEKPGVAYFGFTGCEGCQLQMANKEDTLAAFFSAVEVKQFRLISSDKADDYEIAFVEGSITTDEEVERLKSIREKAKIVVALGACAVTGGVNNLKSVFPLHEVADEVYGNHTIESGVVRKLSDIVEVDFELPGCPVSKAEFEWFVQHVIVGLLPRLPKYAVCVECKQRHNSCVFDMGILCMGPITRAGCNAICPRNRSGCWGCRGPVDEANYTSFMNILRERGFSERQIAEKANFFNAFNGIATVPELER